MVRGIIAALFSLAALATFSSAPGAEDAPLKILFLGDNGSHQPKDRHRQVASLLEKRGILLSYTDQLTSLNAKVLSSYQGLVIYANQEKISPQVEQALLDFVEQGKGLIVLHCGSYCFLNSPKYIDLVGAQFSKHKTGIFRVEQTQPEHPVLRGFRGFESFDETYTHTKHNPKDRTVLEVRQEGKTAEPWTWVRTQGKGRVFYTAWGHDSNTWGNPGFHNLLERGLRWAVGDDPAKAGEFGQNPVRITSLPQNLKPFEYTEADVPFYPAGPQWGKTGDNIKKMQKPLPMEESIKHFVTPAGFKVMPVISEPRLEGKPIAMNWDERGRLWVSLTVDYPNEMKAPGQGRDKIVICEDSNHDGSIDKITTFADKLSIPTSLIFANGGVIVHQAPVTLFLKDTNGDDIADEKKTLFDGWGTRDTHAGPSNMVHGLDNWIYGQVGYSGFEGVVNGERLSFRTGFYRFKPDGSRLEFLRNTNNNSWGVGISEEGFLFGSTANGCPSVHLPIPNRYYEKVRGWSSSVLEGIAGNAPMHPITKKVRQVDWHDHFTAAAGHALYTARNYPREYWNATAFVTEPTGHLVATFPITPDGASFRSKNGWNLLASDDEWCSPIMAEVGPNGNIWVIDWYNFIVQHNPTPQGFKTGKGNAYETELRDKKHGRIYQLAWSDAPEAKAHSLANAKAETLVNSLRHDNFFWRKQAQRLLVERQLKEAIPALIQLVEEKKTDGIGLSPGAMHALWTLQGLGALEGNGPALAAAQAALQHPSDAVRLNALKVLPATADSVLAILNSRSLFHNNPQVRLAALLALADMPAHAEAGKTLVQFLADEKVEKDRWLADAAVAAAASHDTAFLAQACEAKGAAQALLIQTIERVAEHHGRRAAEEVAGLLLQLHKADPAIQNAVVNSLAKGWPANQPLKGGKSLDEALETLFKKMPLSGRGRLAQLGKKWGNQALASQSKEILQRFLAVAADAKASDAERSEMARQALEFGAGDADTAAKIMQLITPQTGPDLAKAFLDSLALSEAIQTGKTLVEKMEELPPPLRLAAIKVLLGRAPWIPQLLDGLDQGKIRLSELSLEQKQALMAGSNTKLFGRVRAILARGGSLPDANREKVLVEYLPLAKEKGDAALGKIVFKNQCAKCHQHSGEGTKIGPDLTGMAAHPKQELLVHILDPNRDVEGNFRVYLLTTKSGKLLNGMLASETRSAVELIDIEAKKITILREDIDEIKVSNRSLMPEGFEKQATKADIANLLEFLSQRGKYLPLPLDKAATVVSTKGMFFGEESQVERLVFPDWGPKEFFGVPFLLVDPLGDRKANAVLLHSPRGKIPPSMPKNIRLPVHGPAKAIHLLSGISGWGYPALPKGSVSLIVRFHYEDGTKEDHELKNGVEFADYIRRVDVPGSQFALALRGQQIRYLKVEPARPNKVIKEVEFLKGPDESAPVIMAVTAESP